LVVLGCPTADSAELYAETVINGDPAWAGPLAGVAMGLNVCHILEPEIKSQIAPEAQKKHLAVSEIALDTDKIIEAMNKVRGTAK